MSDKRCCVPGCTSTQSMQSIGLHGFPKPEKDRARFNAWLMAIGGDILALDNNHISKHRRVCHIHFEERYWCRNKKISNVAVPTLNLRELDGIVLHCFPNPEKDADRFRTWLYAIGGDVLALDNRFIYKSRRVCHKHFGLKYLTWTKRLSPNAIPTLHLPGYKLYGDHSCHRHEDSP